MSAVEGDLEDTHRRPTPKAQTSAPRTFTTEYYTAMSNSKTMRGITISPHHVELSY